jgi:FKBP-type peptidyl-prolyl cis-trans isomerase (trigger factor)
MPEQKPTQIEKDVIVNLVFTLTVDGEIIDEANAEDPFLYLHGHDNVIAGIEKAVAGMKIGESKSFDVEAGSANHDPGRHHAPVTLRVSRRPVSRDRHGTGNARRRLAALFTPP